MLRRYVFLLRSLFGAALLTVVLPLVSAQSIYEVDPVPPSAFPTSRNDVTGILPALHELAVQVDHTRQIAVLRLPDGSADPIYHQLNRLTEDIVQLHLASDSRQRRLIRARWEILNAHQRQLLADLNETARSIPELRSASAALALAVDRVRVLLSTR